MNFIYELHQTMIDKNLILVYEGEITQNITKSVLAMAEKNMEAYEEDSRVKKKVFNVMMECLQNISRHAENIEDRENVQNNAIFIISKRDDAYLITSGNAIYKNKVEDIQTKLERINELDADGIKALMREHKLKIKRGELDLNERGGAGLGFMDMAKKSGNKLNYHFETIDEDLSFFSLETTITRVSTVQESTSSLA